jgi:predicted polyphosphate/ATP-dependent NAD kinase
MSRHLRNLLYRDAHRVKERGGELEADEVYVNSRIRRGKYAFLRHAYFSRRRDQTGQLERYVQRLVALGVAVVAFLGGDGILWSLYR